MRPERREFVQLLSAFLAGAFTRNGWSQSGMATRNVTAQKRPPQSNIPFDAHFTDVAAEAGLKAPVFYGGVDHDDYILEADGCGCAFIDYDNDGWIDIFLLSGTRTSGPPPGSYQPALQEQS